MNATDKTTAEQLLFQLQFMGMMLMVGRAEEADTAYQKALALAKELVEAERANIATDYWINLKLEAER